MLYVCIFSNKFDLIQATRVSHNMTAKNVTINSVYSFFLLWIQYGVCHFSYLFSLKKTEKLNLVRFKDYNLNCPHGATVI
jgi:hypothetical protein